jgi:NAD(P)H-flavin reductase
MADQSRAVAGPGRVVRLQDVGGGVTQIALVPPGAFVASYTTPGQYIRLATGGKSTYFALAGDPGDATWEILVRGGGDVSDALVAGSPDEEVEISGALGEGFPVHEALGRHLYVVATGTGLGAVRPVLRARVREGLATSTELFFGVRRAVDVPLPDELDALRAVGMGVTLCCSREGAPGTGWEPGYVQDALTRRAARAPRGTGRSLVFAAGVAGMIDALRAVAARLGMDETDVRTNY